VRQRGTGFTIQPGSPYTSAHVCTLAPGPSADPQCLRRRPPRLDDALPQEVCAGDVLRLRAREHGQHLCDAAVAVQHAVALCDDLQAIADQAPARARSGVERRRQVGGQVDREGKVEGRLWIRALICPQNDIAVYDGGVGGAQRRLLLLQRLVQERAAGVSAHAQQQHAGAYTVASPRSLIRTRRKFSACARPGSSCTVRDAPARDVCAGGGHEA
jgi:hypothetical protein